MSGRRKKKPAKRAGRPRQIPPQRRRAIAAAAKKGASVAKLSRDYGHARDTIKAILREAGVEVQRQGAAKKEPTPPKPRPEYRKQYQEIGEPPEDPLQAQVWLHKALSTAARHVMLDEDYEGDERARRKELRELARTMQGLIPKSRLYEAEAAVRGDLDKLEEDPGPDYDDAEGLDRTRYRAPPARGG